MSYVRLSKTVDEPKHNVFSGLTVSESVTWRRFRSSCKKGNHSNHLSYPSNTYKREKTRNSNPGPYPDSPMVGVAGSASLATVIDSKSGSCTKYDAAPVPTMSAFPRLVDTGYGGFGATAPSAALLLMAAVAGPSWTGPISGIDRRR